jgi:hypothetical protein
VISPPRNADRNPSTNFVPEPLPDTAAALSACEKKPDRSLFPRPELKDVAALPVLDRAASNCDNFAITASMGPVDGPLMTISIDKFGILYPISILFLSMNSMNSSWVIGWLFLLSNISSKFFGFSARPFQMEAAVCQGRNVSSESSVWVCSSCWYRWCW